MVLPIDRQRPPQSNSNPSAAAPPPRPPLPAPQPAPAPAPFAGRLSNINNSNAYYHNHQSPVMSTGGHPSNTGNYSAPQSNYAPSQAAPPGAFPSPRPQQYGRGAMQSPPLGALPYTPPLRNGHGQQAPWSPTGRAGPTSQPSASSAPPPPPDFYASLVPLFRAVDREGRGQLTEKELGAALVNGDSDFSAFDPHTVRMMIRMFDTDRTGTIGLEEFCGLWSFLSQWRTLFDRFDTDHSVNISLPEFRDALRAFRYTLSDRFTEILFRQYDKRSEGHLSFDLFIQASITLKRMTDSFKRYDTDRDGVIQLTFEDYLEEILRQMR